ncbi:hypothetical protein ACIOBL_01400 [Paenibacillus taichungensis]|uniref:hypothetical protein n=1 Tax=Paenibacillus taichungensis TaxID=484184 RepID=UPI0038275ADB
MEIGLFFLIAIISAILTYSLIKTKKNLNKDLKESIKNMEQDFKDFLEFKESFNYNYHGTLQFKDKYENLLEYYLTMPWMTLNKRELFFKTEEKSNNNNELYEFIVYTISSFALVFSIITILKVAVLPFSVFFLILIIFLNLNFLFNSRHKRTKAWIININLLYIAKAIELRTTVELTKTQLNQVLSDV